MRYLIGLFLCAAAWAQPVNPPSAILKGTPPGGIGAACSGTPLLGYLDSSGRVITCPGTHIWTQVGVGGGGGSITSGAYASLPGTCSTGAMYIFTDAVYSNALCISTNTYSFQEPLLGVVIPPATLTMGWVNQTSATVDTTFGNAILSAVNNGGSAHKWKLRTMAIPTPSNPYTITMWFQPANSLGNGQGNDRYALVFYDSVTGKFNSLDLALFTGSGQTYSVTNWTDATTFSSQLSNGGLGTATFPAAPQSKFGLQIVTDSTNTTYYWSIGGNTWNQLYQEAKNTFVTPNMVGFGINAFDANLIMQIDSFKLTQP